MGVATERRAAQPVFPEACRRAGWRGSRPSTRCAACELFMLVGHVRETWFPHLQVGSPIDAAAVCPGLPFTSLPSALSAWLHGQSRPKAETSAFLSKRGLFLLFLELAPGTGIPPHGEARRGRGGLGRHP